MVAHFAKLSSLKGLFVSLAIVSIFGIYQFLGDLVLGLPTFLTGLRPQYTKAVFGYPRVQATAIEPLYFAGMLFWPMFLMILLLLNNLKFRDFWNFKNLGNQNEQTISLANNNLGNNLGNNSTKLSQTTNLTKLTLNHISKHLSKSKIIQNLQKLPNSKLFKKFNLNKIHHKINLNWLFLIFFS